MWLTLVTLVILCATGRTAENEKELIIARGKLLVSAQYKSVRFSLILYSQFKRIVYFIYCTVTMYFFLLFTDRLPALLDDP